MTCGLQNGQRRDGSPTPMPTHRLTQDIEESAKAVPDRIHYACGQRVLDGWLNVDGFDESYPNGFIDLGHRKSILRLDLTAPHPFPDACFQWGYSEDFLEHLTQAESMVSLCEAHRTFRTGGVLRLSFPGLAGVHANTGTAGIRY